MKQASMLLLSLGCVVVGLLYFGIQKQIIIVRLPAHAVTQSMEGQEQQRRAVTVAYWFQGTFKQEPITIIDTENQADTLRYIITNWLTLMEQAAVLNKKISLESVMISSSHDVYISFDHSICAKNESTYEKWMRIEGLLKTLRAANMGINRVHVLVHHKPLVDAQLDFSKAWPIHGFLER